MSDTTQNLQDLRWNLHITDFGHETPVVEHEQTSEDDHENSQANPINENKKNKKKKKKKGKKSERRKNGKRHRRNKNKSPHRGDDSNSSSSDSSSSASSISSNYSLSTDDGSLLAFGPSNKINNVLDNDDREERPQTSTRIGKEVKKLTVAAKIHELKPFQTDMGSI
jgi:hypothetical protein